MPNFQGTQAFTRQPGSTVQHDSDGRATQVIEWRGAKHKLTAFRSQVPSASPDFPQLALAKPPDEINEGAYIRIRATYGGTSEEVSANYPIDVDDESPTVPVVTQTANYQINTVVLDIKNSGEYFSRADFYVTYRAPINSVSYVNKTKPATSKGKGRSGIAGEIEPTILSVELGSVQGEFDESAFDNINSQHWIGLIKNDWADQWESRIKLKDFQRSSNGQFWRVTEYWTKEIYQELAVEDD